MDFGEVMGVVLPIVYVVLGVALVWFVIELHHRAQNAHHGRQNEGTTRPDA